MDIKKVGKFQLMAKPAGPVCNISCLYCYYLEKITLYPERKKHWKMNDKTLENYIRQTIQSQNSTVIDIVWQGGEPTLLGIEFFQQALKFQRKYKENKTINNHIQTNGINLNEDWVIFLKENDFLVGLSIDGDRISNDAHRLTNSGMSTFDSVMKGIELLKKYKVEFNTLTVVNSENVKRPLDVYKFLKRIGSQYLQFIPLVERRVDRVNENGLNLVQPSYQGKCELTSWSVPASSYGQFLNSIFDYWIKNDVGSTFVMNFEQTMADIVGVPASCVTSEICGRNLILESNGDVYSCDHFVYPENRLGNINFGNIIEMINSSKNTDFGMSKLINISSDCLICKFKNFCNGGCPKHRFNMSGSGDNNKNYLCESYLIYLSHCLPKMQFLVDLLQHQISYKKVKKIIKSEFYN